jgi:flagellar M-ring protein FliF
VAGADGKTTSQAYTQPEIARFESIVREAVGFDAARGDRVQVINQSFNAPAPEATMDEAPLWENPKVLGIGRQAIGAVLVLLVALLVLRPLMKSLTHAAAAPQRGGGGALPDLAGDRVTLSGPGGAPALQPNYEQQVAAARSLVGQDPRRAAEVVKEWVAADGR